MKNNERIHQKMKTRQIMVNKKQSNKDINKIKTNKSFQEYENNTNFIRTNNPSNLYKYRKMSSSLFNQTNNMINSTTKKSKINHHNNINKPKNMKLSNLKGNRSHNLFFSSKTNNLKENISSNLQKNKNSINVGTKLNISKSEIQYPLNYSKNDINSKDSPYNNTNSSTENNNKEINLRISLKYGNKNNNEKIKKYDIASPANKSNNSFGKRLRQSMKNIGHINKRKNKDKYSPDIIKYNNNIKEIKSLNNNFYTKRDNTFINTFNSCYNFYQKDGSNSKSKRKDEYNFNNTMNLYDFYNNNSKIINNNNNENIYVSDISEDYLIENKSNYYNYDINTFYNKDLNILSSSRYRNDESYEEINNNKINNRKKIFSYQNDLIEEFCDCIEEYMLFVVKDNFETFINKLKEYSKNKYLNFLLLKRLQTKTIKKKFYQIRESSYEKSNDSYVSSTTNNNNRNNNNIKKHPFPSNNISKEYIRRKITDNFKNNNFYQGVSKNTYHRKSQEKIIIKNFDSFGNNKYSTNKENPHKEIKVSNEKYDTNLYIPKKYRHINNSTANKNQVKKNISYNYASVNPYFTNISKIKESSKILSPELDNNLSNEIEEEIIKSKLERNSNKKNKKNKNHNVSCDNKHDTKYYIEKGILNKLNSTNDTKNSSMTMNTGQLKESEIRPVYNKKKVKISQTKSKIFKNKQIQENLATKIIHRNNNNLNRKEIMNLNLNKKINNKNKNNNEHYGIMTLSSNISESSNEIDIIHNEKNEFNIISPKIRNKDINLFNQLENNKIKNNINIIENENSFKKQSGINKQKTELNIEKTKSENGNNNDTLQAKEEKNDKENLDNDYDIKMSNGKKETKENIYNNGFISREIIVKDVSTRDGRINVFIKYIDDFSFNQKIHNLSIKYNKKKHLLVIFQTDSIYIPSSYRSKQRNDRIDKFYRSLNDKNHQNRMNKILSSIIEEEEKSKAAGSVNNSIISDEENLKNGNYSYFFIQSIKYFINFLHSILSDKKKSLYFSFFKILKKIKNDSYLKGLIIQKKTQTFNKSKEENEENKENKNNTSGDVILYNINDNLDLDENYFNESKNQNQNQNPKNKVKDLSNSSFEGKYSSDNNFCLFIDDNLYSLNNSNKKKSMSLSMDNFYLNKKRNYKYDKNILKQIMNSIELNKKVKIDKNDFIGVEKAKNGKEELNSNKEKENEIKEDNNLGYEKNVTISEACNRLADVIYDFRLNLIKYGVKSNKKI